MNEILVFIILGLIIGLFLPIASRIYSNLIGKTRRINNKLGNQLIESGFLDFVDTSDFNELKAEIIDSFNIYNIRNLKFTYIDAEELADFNFEFFLPNLKLLLEKRNFNLEVRLAEDYQKTSRILINETVVELYTKVEVEDDTFLETASREFFKWINKLMLSEQIQEKFYLLYGGMDLSVLLITDDQYRIIKQKYFDNENEQPYLP